MPSLLYVLRVLINNQLEIVLIIYLTTDERVNSDGHHQHWHDGDQDV